MLSQTEQLRKSKKKFLATTDQPLFSSLYSVGDAKNVTVAKVTVSVRNCVYKCLMNNAMNIEFRPIQKVEKEKERERESCTYK